MTILPLLALSLIQTGQTPHTLVSLDEVRIQEYKKIQDVRDRLLAADPFIGLVPTSLVTSPEIRDMGLDNDAQGKEQIQYALGYRFDHGMYAGYHPIDFNSGDPILNYTIVRTDEKGEPKFLTLKQGLQGIKMGVYKVKVVETPLPTPTAPANGDPKTTEVYVGVIVKDDLANTLKFDAAHPRPNQAERIQADIVEDSEIPVELYENANHQVLAVLEKEPTQPLLFPDKPEFNILQDSPANVEAIYKKEQHDLSKLGVQEPDFAVKEPNGIADMEHLRRKCYLDLQKLRDSVLAQHPTTADFPPEMVDTSDFKSTGLNLKFRHDQLVLLQALSFTPEGLLLKGYHPIDYTKDKAAQYSAVTALDANNLSVQTVKDSFQGKKFSIYKLKVEAVKNGDTGSTDTYLGPATAEFLAALKKSKPDLKITDLKDDDIPLSIYTNDAGDIAFVLAYRPKQPLLLPANPTVRVMSDPVDKVKPFVVTEYKIIKTMLTFKPGEIVPINKFPAGTDIDKLKAMGQIEQIDGAAKAQELLKTTHQVNVTYAIESN